MRSLSSFLFVLLVLGTLRADDKASWNLYVRAIENDSTAPSYVLISIVDGKTGGKRVVCAQAPFLLGAIHHERGIEYDDAGIKKAKQIALAQKDRTFQFSRSDAVKNVEPSYTDQILNEMRAALSVYSNDQLQKGLTGQQTEISKLYDERRGSLYEAYRDAMAHVLLERGLLPQRGCVAGFLTVGK